MVQVLLCLMRHLCFGQGLFISAINLPKPPWSLNLGQITLVLQNCITPEYLVWNWKSHMSGKLSNTCWLPVWYTCRKHALLFSAVIVPCKLYFSPGFLGQKYRRHCSYSAVTWAVIVNSCMLSWDCVSPSSKDQVFWERWPSKRESGSPCEIYSLSLFFSWLVFSGSNPSLFLAVELISVNGLLLVTDFSS